MNLQELEKLHSLKEKGIITEEEFNERKKQLLDPRSPIEKEFVKLKNSFFESLPTIKLLLKKGMEKGNAKLKNSFSDSLPSLRLLLKKGFVYIFSILSFLSLWGIFAYSLRAFDYKMSSKEMMTIFTLLFISFLFFMFMSRRFFKKIPNVKKHEKFISLKKVYNKAIIIITIILLVITAGLDAKFYFRNNSTQYEYYEDGKVKTESHYKSGENVDSTEYEYYEDGKVKTESHYKSGENVDSTEYEYHDNGKVKMETHYKSGECVDPIKKYYESGALKSEVACSKTSYISYYENGAVKSKMKCLKEITEKNKVNGEIKEKKLCDIWDLKNYYENGKLQYAEDEKERADFFYMTDFFLLDYAWLTRVPSANMIIEDDSRLLCAYDGKLLDSTKQKHTTKEENACKKYADMIKEIGK